MCPPHISTRSFEAVVNRHHFTEQIYSWGKQFWSQHDTVLCLYSQHSRARRVSAWGLPGLPYRIQGQPRLYSKFSLQHTLLSHTLKPERYKAPAQDDTQIIYFSISMCNQETISFSWGKESIFQMTFTVKMHLGSWINSILYGASLATNRAPAQSGLQSQTSPQNKTKPSFPAGSSARRMDTSPTVFTWAATVNSPVQRDMKKKMSLGMKKF